MFRLRREFRDRFTELPKHEQRSRLRAAQKSPRVLRTRAITMLGLFLAVMTMIVLHAAGVIPRLPRDLIAWGWISIAPATVLAMQWPLNRHLREQLVRDRPEICHRCGHLARFVDPCPECGTARRS